MPCIKGVSPFVTKLTDALALISAIVRSSRLFDTA